MAMTSIGMVLSLVLNARLNVQCPRSHFLHSLCAANNRVVPQVFAAAIQLKSPEGVFCSENKHKEYFDIAIFIYCRKTMNGYNEHQFVDSIVYRIRLCMHHKVRR